MSILSKEDRAFWDENGYVIIHDAVPPENINAAEGAIWNFFEIILKISKNIFWEKIRKFLK